MVGGWMKGFSGPNIQKVLLRNRQSIMENPILQFKFWLKFFVRRTMVDQAKGRIKIDFCGNNF